MSNNTEHKIAKTLCKIVVLLALPFYIIAVCCYTFWLLTRKHDYKICYLEPATVGDLYKIKAIANAGDKEADELMRKVSTLIAAYVFVKFFGDWISGTLGVDELLDD